MKDWLVDNTVEAAHYPKMKVTLEKHLLQTAFEILVEKRNCSLLSLVEAHVLKPRRETPIERIFREVMGRKMPLPVKRILLPKRIVRRKAS